MQQELKPGEVYELERGHRSMGIYLGRHPEKESPNHVILIREVYGRKMVYIFSNFTFSDGRLDLAYCGNDEMTIDCLVGSEAQFADRLLKRKGL